MHLIEQLQLSPHPEGGHFRETYRASQTVPTPRGPRPASTAILFLLQAGERSHWHRLHSDEAWHFHAGDGLWVHELSPSGVAQTTWLGMELSRGERPQHVVPAGHWFAAEPAKGGAWSLVSCTVAPGFDFADFELAIPDQLAAHDAALTELCGDWRRFCSLR
ncbi:cupin domain-containing protein [Synechococcus sp. HK05]|uniref:cupin domain-containing protein n=1 Tax=Synechococcus sp. HK05 TaxID=2725975 RepID=UPI001C383F1C|nr:cupin domain-containing protein [Synechococcus sp. HK05]